MATSTTQRSLPMFKQNVAAVFNESSVVVKSVTLAVIVGYLLTYFESTMTYLTVTPGYVMPPNFKFWTFATYSFFETHIWNVIADILVITLCGKLLEPMWGALEMLIFFLVVNTGVAVATTFFFIAVYLVTKNEEYLFETHIHGLAGYLAGFSVAAKQVMPDSVLLATPFGKMRNSHVPILLFLVAIVMRMVGLIEGPFTVMFGFGMLVSWIYLRFYQKHTKGSRGDLADNFDFASFFPSQMKPIITILSNTIFLVLVKIKVCKKPQRKYDVSSPSTITITLPGTDPQDAERRRLLALKALNERLSKSDSQTQWPTLVEEDEEQKGDKSAPQKDAKLPVPDFKNTEVSNTTNEES